MENPPQLAARPTVEETPEFDDVMRIEGHFKVISKETFRKYRFLDEISVKSKRKLAIEILFL